VITATASMVVTTAMTTMAAMAAMVSVLSSTDKKELAN